MKNKLFQNAEFGNQYPAVYISIMADSCFQTVDQWLKDHHAPEEVIDLLDVGQVLTIYAGMKEKGELDDGAADDLVAVLPHACELIYKTGGVFCDSAGNCTTPPASSKQAAIES